MAQLPLRLKRALHARFAKAFLLLALALPVVLVVARPQQRGKIPGFTSDTTSKVGELIVGSRAKRVTFWDGSHLHLEPSARLRVAALSEERTEVRLESGAVKASLVKAEGRDWVISAGPFVLYASGARFRVSTSKDNEELTLDFEAGFARLLGACTGDAIVLNKPRREQFTCSTKTQAPLLTLPTASAATANRHSRHTSHQHPEGTMAREAPEGELEAWQRLARNSDYVAAYSALRKYDLAAACDTWPALRLLEAADLSSVARQPTEAERYLRCVVERFASERELGAAFMRLGKLFFDKDAEKAAHWFLRYEEVFSNGPLVAEALGRALQALAKAGDRPRARQVAERYLTRFPQGPYAPLAEAVRG